MSCICMPLCILSLLICAWANYLAVCVCVCCVLCLFHKLLNGKKKLMLLQCQRVIKRHFAWCLSLVTSCLYLHSPCLYATHIPFRLPSLRHYRPIMKLITHSIWNGIYSSAHRPTEYQPELENIRHSFDEKNVCLSTFTIAIRPTSIQNK